MNKRIDLSIIVPVFNEEGNIYLLYERLVQALHTVTNNFEIIWVNDSSTDRSLPIIKALCRKEVRSRFISFSRNFGHQKAVMAGLDQCLGEAAIIIDADLQDPPELIPQLWQKYEEGYKVVYAQRRSRAGESWFKKSTAHFFYLLLKKLTRIHIPIDTGDYRLIDRKVINCLKAMPEQHKFLRGQIAWIGFKQVGVLYDRDNRFSGKSHYNFSKMFRFAMDGITAFSNYPLRLATQLGFIISILSFLIILYALYSKLVLKQAISGWTSIIISTTFIGGVQLLTIGIIGEYISRINSDVRKRPFYVIEEDSNTINENAPLSLSEKKHF